MFDIPAEIQHNNPREEGINMARKTQNKTSETKLQVNARYLEKLERITIRVYADGRDGLTKETLAQAAERAGESVNTFVIEAIRQRMTKL